MKTSLAILLISITSALGTLIDLTPGGFNENNPPPIFFSLLNNEQIVAGANIDGTSVVWSPFTLFGPANFSIQITDVQSGSASVSWNLTGTPYQSFFVLLEGANGSGLANIYESTPAFLQTDSGFITDFAQVQAITFFATVPENLWTLPAFLFAILILITLQRTRVIT
jgi:hypothetical protein